MLSRSCVDWTQRQPHLASALPAALTHRFLDLGWLGHSQGRGLRIAPEHDQHLANWPHDIRQ
jgi:hypothetical protein